MADTKKKGKLVNRVGWGLVVLFAFAALVPTWISWLAFWSLTALGIASLVIYQRRRQMPWNDLLMDGDGAQKRTTRVATGWLITLLLEIAVAAGLVYAISGSRSRRRTLV